MQIRFSKRHSFPGAAQLTDTFSVYSFPLKTAKTVLRRKTVASAEKVLVRIKFDVSVVGGRVQVVRKR